MTNLEALRESVNYPLSDGKFTKALIDQGVDASATYAGLTQPFELALAAIYVLLVTSANISEGDYQIAATDKSNYMKLASGIYSKYGIENPLDGTPTIVNRSNYW
jgi:hypothetical protein